MTLPSKTQLKRDKLQKRRRARAEVRMILRHAYATVVGPILPLEATKFQAHTGFENSVINAGINNLQKANKKRVDRMEKRRKHEMALRIRRDKP